MKSLSELLKEFGVKVNREFSGYYIYRGKNFTAKFNNVTEVSSWWEVSIWGEGVDKVVYDNFNDYNHFESKKEVLGVLFNLDKSLSA